MHSLTTLSSTSEETGFQARWFDAVIRGNTKDVEEFISLGANINWTDDFDATAFQSAAKGAVIDATKREAQTALHYAAIWGNLDVASLLLSKGAAVDSKDAKAKTPLHHAAGSGHLGLVSLLLSEGAAIDAQDNHWETPLCYAVIHGSKEVSAFLLSKDADINSERQSKVLIYAAKGGHEEVVELLLNAGCAIDIQDIFERTALHYAAKGGHEKVVALLLRKGAAVDARTEVGETALHFASENGHLEVFSLLLNGGANVHTIAGGSGTSLHCAAKNGHQDIVAQLLNAGALIESKYDFGQTALLFAAYFGHQGVVSLLLSKGADPNAKTTSSETALHSAAHGGVAEMIALFLEKGIPVDAKTDFSDTALHCAAEFGHQEVVSLLLNEGAEIDSRNYESKTPLVKAAEGGHHNVMSLLLCKGAEIDAKDYQSLTALHYAAMSGYQEIVCLLLSKGAAVNSIDHKSRIALHYAARRGHQEVVYTLLNSGASFSDKSIDSATALHFAASGGSNELVVLFLELGIPVDAKTKQLFTALHGAAREGRHEVVSLLLSKDAAVDAKDISQKTPLYYAAGNGHQEIVSLLLRKGAAVNAMDSSLRTPLHYAAGNGHLETVLLLLKADAAIDAKDTHGSSVLSCAVRYGDPVVVSLLLTEGAYVDSRDCDSKTALHEAAAYGRYEIMSLLLNNGAAFDAKDSDNMTTLHYAAKGGSIEAVSLLLDKGLAVDIITDFSRTALHYAAASGHSDVVSLLLSREASVDAKDCNMSTPLQIAATMGRYKTVSELISRGADVNQRVDDGNALLFHLFELGHLKMVTRILSLGANTEMTNQKGQTLIIAVSEADPLDIVKAFQENRSNTISLEDYEEELVAPSYGVEEIIYEVEEISMMTALLNRKANMEAIDKDSWTSLHWAVKHGKRSLVHMLLENGAKTEARTKMGNTALHIASKFNQPEIATILLENDADIDAINESDQTAVHIAVLNGHTDLVFMLKAKGASMGNYSDQQLSLLHLAAAAGREEIVKRSLDGMIKEDQANYINATLLEAVQYGHVNLVQYLFNRGANIETRGVDEMTPIFLAGKWPVLVSLLLHCGADTQAKNKDCQFVLHYYASLGQEKAIHVLLNFGCYIQSTDNNGRTALHNAIFNGDSGTVCLLIEHGADLDAKDNAGETALHTAIRHKSLSLVELLIDSAVDKEAKNLEGNSALHCALMGNNPDITSLLVKRQADVNAINKQRETSLHLALKNELVNEAILMIQHGANINAEDIYGTTPLHIAARLYNPSLVKLLLDHGALVNNVIFNDKGWKESPLSNAVYRHLHHYHHSNDELNNRFLKVIALLIEAGANTNIYIPEHLPKWIPELADLFTTTLHRMRGENTMLNKALNIADENNDINVSQSCSEIILEQLKIHSEKVETLNPTHRISMKDIKHKYGSGFPSSRDLDVNIFHEDYEIGNCERVNSSVQSLDLSYKLSVDNLAPKIISSLFRIINVKFFTSENVFMLKSENPANTIATQWVQQFDKMKGIIRESGLILVQIPLAKSAFSIPGWYNNANPLLRFADAVYVCRCSSSRLDEEAFSEILGESEAKLETKLHAVLIAGLSVLSIAGGYGLIENLISAVLSVNMDCDPLFEQLGPSCDWQVLNRRNCKCPSESMHRPLSPVAAAKAAGFDIWREKQEELVSRAWDLVEDRLTKQRIDAREIIFVTHRWSSEEIEYSDVFNNKSRTSQSISAMSSKLDSIRSALQNHTRYVWIDTICIDKSNLSELDQAIRSMYKWYAACAAVVLNSDTPLEIWCKRGWCLQEGIAAGILRGISKDRKMVTIQELAIEQSHELCLLDLHLHYRPGNSAEILARMDVRETTQKEDMAYALIGIFSIHLTLAYGEGPKSRERLLQELATQKGDLSFLSYPTTQKTANGHLPAITEVKYTIASCMPSSVPAIVSHFGTCFEVQLVNASAMKEILQNLSRWMELKYVQGRFSGVAELIATAAQPQYRNSPNIELAFVHDIRSIMIVRIYGEDTQSGGGRPIKLCYRLQCCQIEENEFMRLFVDIDVDFERIWLAPAKQEPQQKTTTSKDALKDDDEFLLSQEQLRNLSRSEAIHEQLKHPQIRNLISAIDSSNDPAKMLDQARQNDPVFSKLVEEMLFTVTGKKAGEDETS
ncbi:hypothetical protein INT44_007379 [Umbelopsis vinacea]|uniref:Heterokaryon incompatibility domain-containing protein n=1 Tax=Umbelopsis vinacea TaxID=44442 RepID=A0A8H7PN37_9FUNG|nr:hypothetical protein INT44_007379 [Umbelopsis vinacea]